MIELASAVPVNNPSAVKVNSRLLSLDALRGFDMFWIISGEEIFHGFAAAIKQKYTLVQDPESWQIAIDSRLSVLEKIMVGISNQLHHSVWNGFTFYDLIFPLFIFIAGVSMPFSYARYLDGNEIKGRGTKRQIYISLVKRTVLLIVLGMVVNGLLKFQGYESTRFASVLGRIALACFFAALIYLNCSLKKQVIWFGVILLGYWAMMTLIPVPVYGNGIFTPAGNLAAFIDRLLLPGKLHRQVYDPEGLLSTVPAVGTALLGVFTGQFLRTNVLINLEFTPGRKGATMILGGIVMVGAGLMWDLLFPINKIMWTSSFVLFAGGLSLLVFSIFYLAIDVWELKKWSKPLIWIGTNSILIYMAAHGLVNFQASSEFIFGGLINRTPEVFHHALIWIGVFVIQLFLLRFLYKRKMFLKL
ncbi:acyltransferase family protein [Desertivirga brevis]|uniref:acyltransferase family protein n=1 Tax=Desertivirga brevis TaxID=2810310 RepID=UPI001A964B2C|nr:DUF5009 domain-containing protein [Pedobacter sp. SYSU D00873]